MSKSSLESNQNERFAPLLSFRGRNAPAAAITDPRTSANYISFIYGFPDADSLPNASVAAATKRALENMAIGRSSTEKQPVLASWSTPCSRSSTGTRALLPDPRT